MGWLWDQPCCATHTEWSSAPPLSVVVCTQTVCVYIDCYAGVYTMLAGRKSCMRHWGVPCGIVIAMPDSALLEGGIGGQLVWSGLSTTPNGPPAPHGLQSLATFDTIFPAPLPASPYPLWVIACSEEYMLVAATPRCVHCVSICGSVFVLECCGNVVVLFIRANRLCRNSLPPWWLVGLSVTQLTSTASRGNMLS